MTATPRSSSSSYVLSGAHDRPSTTCLTTDFATRDSSAERVPHSLLLIRPRATLCRHLLSEGESEVISRRHVLTPPPAFGFAPNSPPPTCGVRSARYGESVRPRVVEDSVDVSPDCDYRRSDSRGRPLISLLPSTRPRFWAGVYGVVEASLRPIKQRLILDTRDSWELVEFFRAYTTSRQVRSHGRIDNLARHLRIPTGLRANGRGLLRRHAVRHPVKYNP